MEIYHYKKEKNIKSKFNNYITNGPNQSYYKRLKLFNYFKRNIKNVDLENIFELLHHTDKDKIKNNLPEYYYNFFLHLLSVNGSSVWSDDFNSNCKNYENYTDKIWELVGEIYKNNNKIDPYINHDKRLELIQNKIKKPKYDKSLEKYISTHDLPSVLNVCHQYWIVNQFIRTSLKLYNIYARNLTNFFHKPININGQTISLWHRPNNNVDTNKIIIFFHGTFIGGMTAYMIPLNELIEKNYYIISYEIPNLANLEYENPYPSIEMINYAILEQINSLDLIKTEKIKISIYAHSLGCDYATSLIQLWSYQNPFINSNFNFEFDKVLLIEPFSIMNYNSIIGRRMAFKIPEKFPKWIWNLTIGNLYTQLALKRSMPRSSLVWLNPYEEIWQMWNKKSIITSKSDKSVLPNSIQKWIDDYSTQENSWNHLTIPGNHGGWVTKPDLLRILKSTIDNSKN